MLRKKTNERAQLTHSNKPINPKITIVANRPSTEASKPCPRHTVLPARENRPLADIGEEVEEGVEDEPESRGVFVKEFVVESREKDDEVKDGEVERDDVGMVYWGDVEDIPEAGDDEMSHELEHESEGAEREGVPDAHRSRIIGARFNLERPSPVKAKSDMAAGDTQLGGVSNQTLKRQTTCETLSSSEHSKGMASMQGNIILMVLFPSPPHRVAFLCPSLM
jgi:hypothetical protein